MLPANLPPHTHTRARSFYTNTHTLCCGCAGLSSRASWMSARWPKSRCVRVHACPCAHPPAPALTVCLLAPRLAHPCCPSPPTFAGSLPCLARSCLPRDTGAGG
jgi:hypothetical protein